MTQDELNKLYKDLHADEEDHTEEWWKIIEDLGGVQITESYQEYGLGGVARKLIQMLEEFGCVVLDDPD